MVILVGCKNMISSGFSPMECLKALIPSLSSGGGFSKSRAAMLFEMNNPAASNGVSKENFKRPKGRGIKPLPASGGFSRPPKTGKPLEASSAVGGLRKKCALVNMTRPNWGRNYTTWQLTG